MTISIPTKTTVPFAASGDKNSIPVPSQSGGVASFTAGFPPLTMTPKASGGVPPSGKDMNGILFNLSQAIQYEQAGGHFPYDSSFASTVGGYPVGAIVQSTDNSGFWVNGTANNSSDPESFGAGWLPLKQAGATLLTVASTNVTLTALQAAKDTFVISGTLTQNVNIIVPTWAKSWAVVNNATMGAYSITIKTASGTGAILLSGANEVIGDGTNVSSLTYLLATKVYADNAATTAASSLAIGVGQTWQDVSSSRTTGQDYVNSSGKPILVQVSDKNVVNHGLEMFCDGVTVGYFNFTSGDTNSSITTIIPNGSTYRVNKLGSVGTQQHIQWSELRQ
jgi:hypothetical protein